MEKDKIFETRDIVLASTLVLSNFYMLEIEKIFEYEGTFGIFKFDHTDELQKTIERFWHGLILVEPRKLVTNMRALKGQVNYS